MATFQGRVGPSTKTVTRKVGNIIYDSAPKTTEIIYENFYYPTHPNPYSYEEVGTKGLSYEVVRSGLLWNHLELDNSTLNHYQPNGYLSTDISEFVTFYNTFGNPLVENYSSLFDQLYPQEWASQVNEKPKETARYILLSNNDRKTATLPFKHFHGDSPLSHTNDAFHFSMAEDSIASNSPDDILSVVVYRSVDSYDDAIGDLKKFYRGNTSTKVSEHTFEYTKTSWESFSVDLRNLQIPAGDCLLWLEFIRLPVYPTNPFSNPDYYTGRYNITVNSPIVGATSYALSGFDDTGSIVGNNIDVQVEVGDTIKFHATVPNNGLWIRTVRNLNVGDSNVANLVGPGSGGVALSQGSQNGIVTWTPQDAGTYYYQSGTDITLWGRIIVIADSGNIQTPAGTTWDTELIENTWYNFSHTRVYPDTTPTYPFKIQDTTGWIINPNTVSLEANTDPQARPIGFVSGGEHEDYILETVVKSTSFDDDAMGVVIGFVYENGYEYTLTAYRSQGGVMRSKTWFVVANAGQSVGFTGTNYNALGSPMHYGVWDNSPSVGFATNEWATKTVGTKIRVEKTGNQVKVYTSQMNSTTIDLNTEIVIPLTGDNAKFKRSKIGFSSWGQPLAQFHDVYFETIHTGQTEIEVKGGNVGVGGFGLEQTQKLKYFRNPKVNSDFIQEYTHEKFNNQKSAIIVESFNSITGTFSTYEEDSSKKLLDFNRNIFIHKQSLLFTVTGNEYTDKPTIGDWRYKPFMFVAKSRSIEINPFEENMPPTSFRSWGGILMLETADSTSESVSLNGVTYNFPNMSGHSPITKDFSQSPFSKHLESFNPLNLNYETELSRSIHYTIPSTHDVMELESGLFLLEPQNQYATVTRSLNYGPPTDIPKPISNFGIGNPRDTFSKNNQFFDLLSNYDYKDGQYVELTKNTSLGDTTWKETIKVLNFDFSKTAYFEYSQPLEIPIKVFYTPVLDKPFVHKVFFINFDTGKPKFKPFLQSPDTSFLIEQNYMHSMISIAKGPKNKFKHLMIEELFRPGFRDQGQVYEFVMNQFEVVAATQFDYAKFGYTYYEAISTNRPSLSGGSNAFGHDVLPIDTGPDTGKNKMFDMDKHIENSLQGAGRSGTHRDNEYREVQTIELYEFQYLDWDIETQSPYSEEWRANKAKSTFNFIYTIDDTQSNGRLPECLTFNDGRMYGQIQDTDKFLRKYSWEPWTKLQGATDPYDRFTSFFDSQDFSYEDFELITPRQWEVNLTGRSITKGTIDVVYTGVVLQRGNIMRQTIDGVLSEFEIIEKISEYTKQSDRGSGLVTETIHRYDFENLRGDIEVTTITDLFTSEFIGGKAELQNEIVKLQDELAFSVDMRASRLQQQIASLNETIIENDSVNPTGYGYISQTKSGSQVDFQYVSNEDDDIFIVDSLNMITSGTVSKFVKLIFKIRNNWSFDRDLRLFTEDGIDDSGFSTRAAWIENERSNSRGLFNPQVNNNSLDSVLIEYMKDYNNSSITIDQYIEKRDIIIESRTYIDPDQKIEYINYLDKIIYIDIKTDIWNRDSNLINEILTSNFTNKFPVNDGKNRGEILDTTSETENGKQVYKLNCSINVDEQTFYNNVDDVRVIRGYPVYASCN